MHQMDHRCTWHYMEHVVTAVLVYYTLKTTGHRNFSRLRYTQLSFKVAYTINQVWIINVFKKVIPARCASEYVAQTVSRQVLLFLVSHLILKICHRDAIKMWSLFTPRNAKLNSFVTSQLGSVSWALNPPAIKSISPFLRLSYYNVRFNFNVRNLQQDFALTLVKLWWHSLKDCDFQYKNIPTGFLQSHWCLFCW